MARPLNILHWTKFPVRHFHVRPLVALTAVAALVCLGNPDSISRADSHSKLSFKARQDLMAIHYPDAVAAADLNGDGIPDIVVGNYGSGNIAIFYGSAAGSFEAPKKIPVGAGPIAIVLADFNKDGHPDIAVANWFSSTVSILVSDGKGGFAPPATLNVGEGPTSLVAADINNDGS